VKGKVLTMKLLMRALLAILITLSGIPIFSVILSRYYKDSLESRAVRVQYSLETSWFYLYGNESSLSPSAWNHAVGKKHHIERLHWTSVHGGNDAEAYHFVSAYLDNRPMARNRPAVVVIGYFSRTAKPADLYYRIKLSNGRSACFKKKVIQEKSNCDSVVDNRKSKPMLYICRLGSRRTNVLPVSVSISNVSNCDAASSSAEIPVGNLEQHRRKLPRKKFGVFLGGPLVLKEHLIENLTRFIQMSRMMGADLFTMYVNPELSGQEAIKFLQKSYPDLVRLIEWRNFQVHRPLHYYGQLVLITDCLYRSMYEVDYLVMMDLDEMILPVNHNSWAELVASLEKKGSYAAFSFLNRFFAPPSHFDSSPDFNSTTSFDSDAAGKYRPTSAGHRRWSATSTMVQKLSSS